MKKKSMISERRILIGLMGLLFVSGFIHTMGILNLSRNLNVKADPESQTAQVFSGSCITVAPKSFLLDGIESPNNPGELYNKQIYNVNVAIRNSCNHSVYIIKPNTLIDHTDKTGFANQLVSMGVQYYNGATDGSVDVNPANPEHNIRISQDLMICNTCQSGNFTYLPTSTDILAAATIPATSIKNFSFVVEVSTLDENYWSYRALLKNIKWFMPSALSDNQVTDTEIRTLSIASSVQKDFSTDYMRVYRGE